MAKEPETRIQEISVKDLVMRVWRRRGLVVVMPVIFGLAGVLIAQFNAVTANSPIVHHINLIGLEKDSYPNGVKFSVKDLEAPEVLAAVAQQLNIKDDGSFLNAIDVVSGGPNVAGVLRKYYSKLERKSLKVAEVDTINADLQKELESVRFSSATINVNYQALGLSSDQGKQVALAIPKFWQQIYTTKYRTIDDTSLAGVAQNFNLSVRNPSDAIEIGMYLRTAIKTLQVIANDNRLASVQTARGQTASDLKASFMAYKDLYLTAILSHAEIESDVLTKLHLRNIRSKIEKSDRRIRGVDEAITSLVMLLNNKDTSKTQDSAPFGSNMQLSGGVLNEIVDLVNRTELSKYYTQLSEKRLQLIDERSELAEQAREIGILEPIDNEFFEEAKLKINSLGAEYQSLLSNARGMNKSNNSTFFQHVGTPFEIVGGKDFPSTFRVARLAILTGVFLSIALALVLPGRVVV